MSTPTLHVLAPALLSPPSVVSDHAKLRPLVLEKSLNWAVTAPGASSYTQQLHQLTLLPSDAPSAPYALLGEGLEPGDQPWVQADPVHLRADLGNLLQFPGRDLEIAPEEAAGLAAEFNAYFAGQGLELCTPHPWRWYLRLGHAPRLETFTLDAVAGRSPADPLPRGGEAGEWQALLTETQMLFHASVVNQRRRAAGQPEINGLWLHGAGRMLAPPAGHAHLKRVAGDDVLALGAAMAAGAKVVPWDAKIGGDELRQYGALLEAQQRVDMAAWLRALENFEHWFGQAFDWLAEHREHCLQLYPCQGQCFRLDGRKISRFWHRLQPFYRFLQ